MGDCSKDDQKDLEYIPKHLFLPNDLVEEVAKEEEKKPNNFEDYQGKKRFHPTFFFFNFVIRYGKFHFVIGHPTVKKVQRAHKVKASSLSFFPA